MTAFFRQLIAARVAKATGLSEECLLPLVSPLSVSKKRVVPVYGLTVKPLFKKNGLENKIDYKNALQDYTSQIASKVTCPAHVDCVKPGGNGMLLFEVSSSMVTQKVLQQVQNEKDCYGTTPEPWQDRRKDKIIVEYSSPNIAKPFHAGHLRSTLIGNCIANLHAALGHNVIRMNYLGDWGVQFGLLGVGYRKFGSETLLSTNPIKHLFDVYVQINKETQSDESLHHEARKFAQAMEEGNSDCLNLWQRFRDFSISDYSRTYQRLGVVFDVYEGESQYREKAYSLLATLREKDLLKISEEGTGIVDLSDLSLPRRSKFALLMKSDGSTLYLTRDIAAALVRFQTYGFDRIDYVVDKSQEAHFEQLTGVLRKMDLDWAEKCHHIKFGRVLGMQTRKGNVVLLEDILEEAKSRMLLNMQEAESSKAVDNPEEVAETLGVSALIVQDLKTKLRNDYSFDWARILTSQGDTGVFLQYTHARLFSIEQLSGMSVDPACDTSSLREPEAVLLAHHLSLFATAIVKAHTVTEPSHLVSYMLQLCHCVSLALNVLRVKDAPVDEAKARLLLFSSSRTVLANGLKILGITPLNRM